MIMQYYNYVLLDVYSDQTLTLSVTKQRVTSNIYF